MGGAVGDEGQGIRQSFLKLYVWLHIASDLTLVGICIMLGMYVVILFVGKVDYLSIVVMLGLALLIAGAGCVIFLLSIDKLRNLLSNRDIKPTGRGMEN
mgnify:CR=1 FL=1